MSSANTGFGPSCPRHWSARWFEPQYPFGQGRRDPTDHTKALTIARNLNAGRPLNFVIVDLDMRRHYRPLMNVQRSTLQSGKGYQLTGHHEIMVPLLAWSIVERLGRD